MCQGNNITEDPRHDCEQNAEPGSHDGRIVQRVADSHKTVIGHDSQEEIVNDNKDNRKVHLCDAAVIRDGLTLGLNVHQHLGD